MTEVNVKDLMVRINKAVAEDRKIKLKPRKATPIFLSMSTSQEAFIKYKKVKQIFLIKRHQFLLRVYKIPYIGSLSKSLVSLIKKLIR